MKVEFCPVSRVSDDTLLKMNDTDQQLLLRYKQDRAEDAFAEIVLQKAIVTATVGLVVVVFIAYHLARPAKPDPAAASLWKPSENPTETAAQNGGLACSQTNPDPIKLQRTVMRARQRIHSGSNEFQYSVNRFGIPSCHRPIPKSFTKCASSR